MISNRHRTAAEAVGVLVMGALLALGGVADAMTPEVGAASPPVGDSSAPVGEASAPVADPGAPAPG